MKFGARYKVIGKKRFAKLDMSYTEVLDAFEDALCNMSDESRLVGSVDRETGVFKLECRVKPGKKDTFESYCMLVKIIDKGDGTTKIEYAFVYDRFISWYTRILSIICFLIPLATAAFVYFEFQLRSLKNLIFYIPLLLISAFGMFSLLGYHERKDNAALMVEEFEELLISIFEE